MHVCGIQKNGTDEPICKAEIKTDVENVWTPSWGGGGGGGGGGGRGQGIGEWDKLGSWD